MELCSCWKLFQSGAACSADPSGEENNFVLDCTATGVLDLESTLINGVMSR